MLKNLFKSTPSEEVDWLRIESIEDLNHAIARSSDKPTVLFKHSTRCPVSSMAKNGLQREWSKIKEKVAIYYLDLLQYRNLSNEIAQRFDVEHQSPQIVVLKNEKVIGHASHSGVSVDFIEKLIN